MKQLSLISRQILKGMSKLLEMLFKAELQRVTSQTESDQLKIIHTELLCLAAARQVQLDKFPSFLGKTLKGEQSEA